MIRSRSGIQKSLCVFLLALTLWSGPLTSGATEPGDQESAIAHFNALMREDRRAEALPLCRQYALDYPDDPAMLYNLACLENTVGEPERATVAFRAALAAGFSDLDLAAADPDLQSGIRGTIGELITAEQERLAALSGQQGLTLILDTWSAPLPAPGAGNPTRGRGGRQRTPTAPALARFHSGIRADRGQGLAGSGHPGDAITLAGRTRPDPELVHPGRHLVLGIGQPLSVRFWPGSQGWSGRNVHGRAGTLATGP